MNFIKRLIYACHYVWHALLVRIVAWLMCLFYIGASLHMFWSDPQSWHTASRTILLHFPIVLFVAVVILVFVYAFMKKKVQQCKDALACAQQETAASASLGSDEQTATTSDTNQDAEQTEN